MLLQWGAFGLITIFVCGGDLSSGSLPHPLTPRDVNYRGACLGGRQLEVCRLILDRLMDGLIAVGHAMLEGFARNFDGFFAPPFDAA